MALLVAVSKVVNSPIFDIHCKHWKFFYAIKNLWIPTGTGKALIIAWHFFQKTGEAYTSLHFEIPKWRDPSFQEFWARWLGGMKQTGFLEVLLILSSHFLLPDSLYVHDTDILKRHRSWLAFSGCRDHWYKVPLLHRGHHRQLNK